MVPRSDFKDKNNNVWYHDSIKFDGKIKKKEHSELWV